jgi:hypothetical protein
MISTRHSIPAAHYNTYNIFMRSTLGFVFRSVNNVLLKDVLYFNSLLTVLIIRIA